MVKILAVESMVIGDQTATGRTLDHILNNIPDSEILQYCLDYDKSYHTPTVKTIYEDKKSNLIFFLCKSVYRKMFNTKDKPNELKKNISSVQITKKNDSIKKKIIVALVAYLDTIKHHVSSNDFNEIKKFDPDVLYLNGSSITSLSIALQLSKKLNIPIVFHMMDNWIDEKYNNSLLTYFQRKKLIYLTSEIHKRSIINIAIGEKMAKYYSQKFHKEYKYAMNCVDTVYYTEPSNAKPIKLIFSGGLHGGRINTLKKFNDLLNKINQSEIIALMDVYTSKVEKKRYKKHFSKSIKIHEYVPENQIFKNLSSADILVHVESFVDADISFFEYSMSTKIPEYLSVGRPILCYGPSKIATVEYIGSKNVGLVCETDEELYKNLKLLIENVSLRKTLGLNAIDVVKKNHLTTSVCTDIRNIFIDTIEKWNK